MKTFAGEYAGCDESMIVREVDGELLILDNQNNMIHQLNRTAGVIWRLCMDGLQPQAITAEIVRHFDVDEQRAHEDVLTTLKQLGSLALLDRNAMCDMHAKCVDQDVHR